MSTVSSSSSAVWCLGVLKRSRANSRPEVRDNAINTERMSAHKHKHNAARTASKGTMVGVPPETPLHECFFWDTD